LGLSTRVKEGALGDVDLVAIVKQVAPTADAATDEELGVGEFQNKYFHNYPTYLDKQQDFFKILGSKPFSLWTLLGSFSLNPFSGFGFAEFGRRWKKQGITQNMKGDYHLKGGVLIYGVDGKIAYQESEQETQDLGYDQIVSAALALAKK